MALQPLNQNIPPVLPPGLPPGLPPMLMLVTQRNCWCVQCGQRHGVSHHREFRLRLSWCPLCRALSFLRSFRRRQRHLKRIRGDYRVGVQEITTQRMRIGSPLIKSTIFSFF